MALGPAPVDVSAAVTAQGGGNVDVSYSAREVSPSTPCAGLESRVASSPGYTATYSIEALVYSGPVRLELEPFRSFESPVGTYAGDDCTGPEGVKWRIPGGLLAGSSWASSVVCEYGPDSRYWRRLVSVFMELVGTCTVTVGDRSATASVVQAHEGVAYFADPHEDCLTRPPECRTDPPFPPDNGKWIERFTGTGERTEPEGSGGRPNRTVRLPGIRIGDARILEEPATTRRARLVVSLDRPAAGSVTVRYTTVDGTARAGADYESARGTVRIPNRGRRVTVAVPVTGDTAYEPVERFFVLLTAPVGARLVDGRGTATIVDRHPPAAPDGAGARESGGSRGGGDPRLVQQSQGQAPQPAPGSAQGQPAQVGQPAQAGQAPQASPQPETAPHGQVAAAIAQEPEVQTATAARAPGDPVGRALADRSDRRARALPAVMLSLGAGLLMGFGIAFALTRDEAAVSVNWPGQAGDHGSI